MMFLAVSPLAAQTSPNAEQIYLKAIEAMRALPQPASIAYTIDASGSLHPTCEASKNNDRDIDLDAGRTAQSKFSVIYYPGGETARTEDLGTHAVCKGFGLFSPVPDLNPDYNKRQAAKHDAKKADKTAKGDKDDDEDWLPGDDGLRYAVQDVRPDYSIAVAFAPAIEGHNVYRLVFSPRIRSKAREYPLREMLVDTETSRVREIKYDSTFGNFIGDFHLVGDLKLGPAGGYWVVTDFGFSGTGRVMLVQKTFALSEHAHDFVFLERKQGSSAKAP
jgi:hypothetical protein